MYWTALYYTGLLLLYPPLCITYNLVDWTFFFFFSFFLCYNPLITSSTPDKACTVFLKKDDVTYKLRAICMPCTSFITYQESIIRKCCYTISGLVWWKPLRGAALHWPNTPSSERTVNDCFSCFWFEYCVSNGEKKKICAVYSGYLEREMENINGPKKYT